MRLFFKQRTYSIDLPTGAVIVETVRPRPVLFEMNQLHLNTPKRIWTYLADLYAISLVFLAISGMFVLKGPLGITGRGAWMTTVGVVVPVGYWVYHLYLEP